jgi:hypothetical protein
LRQKLIVGWVEATKPNIRIYILMGFTIVPLSRKQATTHPTKSTEAQYLIINALDTLGLLVREIYYLEQGVWYIETPSLVLPIAIILPSGDVFPTTWEG